MVDSQIIRSEYSEPQNAAPRAIHIGVGQDADLSASRYAWSQYTKDNGAFIRSISSLRTRSVSGLRFVSSSP
jgi:hypothetical protein